MNRLIATIFLLLLGSGAAHAQHRPVTDSRWESAPVLKLPAALNLEAPAAAVEVRSSGLRLPGDRMASRAPAGSWALIAGGAVLGAVVGFTAAAPDCLSGDTGCGSRPLQYTLLGSVVGAAAGWALSSFAG